MQHYELPGTPGEVLGYTKKGRPVRLIAGGSGEEGDEGGTEGTGTEGGAEADPGGSDEPGATGTSEPAGTSASGSTATDADARKAIAAVREDFKAERRRRQDAEKKVADIQAALDLDKAERSKQREALAVAMGLKSGDEPPDPAKLAEELKAARAEAQAEIAKRDTQLRTKTVELAALSAAARLGADGPALLDSRAFVSTATGLDPASAEFAADLDEAITKVLATQPRYKLVQPKAEKPPPAVARSGGEHTAPGGNRQWTEDDVTRAAPSELTEAIEQGLLVDLGFGARKKRR